MHSSRALTRRFRLPRPVPRWLMAGSANGRLGKRRRRFDASDDVSIVIAVCPNVQWASRRERAATHQGNATRGRMQCRPRRPPYRRARRTLARRARWPVRPAAAWRSWQSDAPGIGRTATVAFAGQHHHRLLSSLSLSARQYARRAPPRRERVALGRGADPGLNLYPADPVTPCGRSPRPVRLLAG